VTFKGGDFIEGKYDLIGRGGENSLMSPKKTKGMCKDPFFWPRRACQGKENGLVKPRRILVQSLEKEERETPRKEKEKGRRSDIRKKARIDYGRDLQRLERDRSSRKREGGKTSSLSFGGEGGRKTAEGPSKPRRGLN